VEKKRKRTTLPPVPSTRASGPAPRGGATPPISGQRTRPEEDPLAGATSQLRRRFAIEVEKEVRRAAAEIERSTKRPDLRREPSDMRIDIVEDTPRPSPGTRAGKTRETRDGKTKRSTRDTKDIPTPRPRIAMSCIPRRVMTERELLALPLDHRAGFVLAHIDGKTNIRTLVDVCSMSPEEIHTTIERLVELGVIRLV
jgi:hypothetical protein